MFFHEHLLTLQQLLEICNRLSAYTSLFVLLCYFMLCYVKANHGMGGWQNLTHSSLGQYFSLSINWYPTASRFIEKAIRYVWLWMWRIAFLDLLYWTELHPDEGGINVLYSFRNSDEQLTRWSKRSVSLSSRVHEYGGGAFIVYNSVIYYVDHTDQKVHMMSTPLQDSSPLSKGKNMRYADCAFHPNATKLICVREDHSVVESGASKEAQNTIVLLDIASQTETVLVCDSHALC